jgi:murein DD-endopeptidase MepM/ murein hydrolase activator NlpD
MKLGSLRSLVALLLLAGCAEEIPQVNSRIRIFTVANDDNRCSRMSWPVDAPLSSPFGRREGRAHDGIDLAAPEGTPVRAACDGAVVYAGHGLRGYGNLLILQHSAALATIYAHNSALLVGEGAQVERGALIARSGATGHVTAPHLHFEVRQDGRPRDPLEYLDDQGPSHRVAGRASPRRAGLSQAGHPLQGRDPADRARPVVPAVH